jgi:cysteine-rich repeat protein
MNQFNRTSRVHYWIIILGLNLGLSSVYATPTPPIAGSNETIKDLTSQSLILKTPTLFKFQARISPAKVPSGRGSLSGLEVFIYNASSPDVLCHERFDHPAQIREGLMNLEIGRNMNCSLDDVIAENSQLYIDLCINGESCLGKIRLNAVPFALRSNYSEKALSSHTATLSYTSSYGHRITADQDLFFPSEVGVGYFDFYTPTDQGRDSLYGPFGDSPTQPYNDAGFFQWTPVRGDKGGLDFNANELHIGRQDHSGNFYTLKEITLNVTDTSTLGKARVYHDLTAKSMRLKGTLDVEQEATINNDVTIDQGGLTLSQGDLYLKSSLTLNQPTISIDPLLEVKSEGIIFKGAVDTNLLKVEPVELAQPGALHVHGLHVEGASTITLTDDLNINGGVILGPENSRRAKGSTVLSADALTIQSGGADVSHRVTLNDGNLKVDGSLIIKAETRSIQENNEPPRDYKSGDLVLNGTRFLEVIEDEPVGEPVMREVRVNPTPAAGSRTVISAQSIQFKKDAIFNGGGLGSECTLTQVQGVENETWTFKCNDDEITFQKNQCGNGRQRVCACGDGEINAGEECDDQNDVNTDACLNSCIIAECGDGISRTDLAEGTEGYEECDNGRANFDQGSCTTSCTVAACGDGFVHIGSSEECDDAGESANCNTDCTVSVCGDGKLNTTDGEECDTAGESATCNADCTLSACGDGILNASAGERCDDSGQSAGCNSDCSLSVCGDGIHNSDAGEQCDDGNNNDMDGCLASNRSASTRCRTARCGDGVTWSGHEECDDRNNNTRDLCDSCNFDCNPIDKVAHVNVTSSNLSHSVFDNTVFLSKSAREINLRVNTRTDASNNNRSDSGNPCVSFSGSNFPTGREAAIVFEVQGKKKVIFDIPERNFDTALFVRRDQCEGDVISCDDDGGAGLASRLKHIFTNTSVTEKLYVFLSGYSNGSGTATVSAKFYECDHLSMHSSHIHVDRLNWWSWWNWFNRRSGTVAISNSSDPSQTSISDGCGGGGSKTSKAVRVVIERPVRFIAETGSSSFDTVLHLRRSNDCAQRENITCNDDGGSGLNSRIDQRLGRGTYYLVLDGYAGRTGSTTIHWSAFPY